MVKVKVTFANGVVRSGKGKTAEAAVAKLKKYAGSLGAITAVDVKGAAA
jgi:adenosyl cobinamide kinase/adenosyl cobinamide phosphate guanylyltransferase